MVEKSRNKKRTRERETCRCNDNEMSNYEKRHPHEQSHTYTQNERLSLINKQADRHTHSEREITTVMIILLGIRNVE